MKAIQNQKVRNDVEKEYEELVQRDLGNINE